MRNGEPDFGDINASQQMPQHIQVQLITQRQTYN